MMKIKSVLTILCLILSTANAYGFSINIDPPSIYTAAKQGQSVTEKIIVSNHSEKEMTINIYYQDWHYDESGNKVFLSSGKSPFSLGDNIQIFTKNLTLKKAEKKEVYFRITSPKEQAGGMYGVIFFETQPVHSKKNASVLLSGRLGSILYHTIEGTQAPDLTIDINDVIEKGEDQAFVITIENKGNIHLRPKGSLLLTDPSTHDVIDRVSFPDIRLLPNDRKTVSLHPTKQLAPGNYSAIITITLEDKPNYQVFNLTVK